MSPSSLCLSWRTPREPSPQPRPPRVPPLAGAAPPSLRVPGRGKRRRLGKAFPAPLRAGLPRLGAQSHKATHKECNNTCGSCCPGEPQARGRQQDPQQPCLPAVDAGMPCLASRRDFGRGRSVYSQARGTAPPKPRAPTPPGRVPVLGTLPMGIRSWSFRPCHPRAGCPASPIPVLGKGFQPRSLPRAES